MDKKEFVEGHYGNFTEETKFTALMALDDFTSELANDIGLIADTADNFLEYAKEPGAFSKLALNIRLAALEHGLTDIRDSLRKHAIELGLDEDTWVEP